ncbi:hypothetical protein HF086_015328 [Spodoptera exigua]|uniref:Uncharacterized protein n=1 Tax=Spodoptera exigua TaxID=7107 RepID=A0A922M063_SPOEX|nr:hypothetical protein HF086_015328 [Spodoptera exigua]
MCTNVQHTQIYNYFFLSSKVNNNNNNFSCREILIKNGSAVDAAVAAMFCNGLLNHQSMGLGGGFFMTVYLKDEEKAYTVNARETAPGAATVDMFNGSWDKAAKATWSSGPLSIGVPGELRGMWAAHKRWGKLPWETLVAPSLDLCRNGFAMSKVMYDGLESAPYIKNDPHLRKMYFNTAKGQFHKPGTMVKPSEALCNTYQRIAENGGDDLYNGTLAADFLDDLERVGSIITAEDLRQYEAKITEPIAVPLSNGDTFYSPPPPSSGAILVTIRKLWFDQSIKEAVDEARIHHQITPMHVEYEFGVIEDIVKGLRAKGHGMVRYRSRGSIICALYRNRTAIYANADFRKGGDVAGMD